MNSILRTLLFFVALTAAGCVSGDAHPEYVRQDISKAAFLRPGMSTSDALNVMGEAPVKSEFDRGIEEWHYAKTGGPVDQFVALFFQNNKLVATRNYSVTIRDTQGVYGSAENFIKMGNYREPDEVKEIRVKVR